MPDTATLTPAEAPDVSTLDRSQIHVGEPEGEPLLDADNLIAGYLPGVNILNGASLTLHDGEIVGIIGPNGAGKSTLLKSLFGLVHIHSGKLTLKGQDITNLRADKLVSRGVGFVPQTENVFPSLTIAENMHMGAYQAPKLFNERFDYVCSIFPSSATAGTSWRASSPAASGRWWRWGARS